MDFQIGDVVRTKKQHPCGSKLWEITRVGVDFKLKCQGCRTRSNATERKSVKSDYEENRKGRGIASPKNFYLHLL